MNSYTRRVLIPLYLLVAVSVVGAILGYVQIHWGLVFLAWFLIGPVGIGVGFHRLFSHRQFETYRPIELTLATLGTLSAYAPLLFWVSQHQYHHQHSDEPEDPSSPIQVGFLESFLWYRLRESVEQKIDLKSYCSKRALLDPTLRSLSRHFIKIIWATVFVLFLIDRDLLVSLYLIPVIIEHTRINLISSAAHIALPGSYRNYETSDTSQNNLILGYLTMGFAWHNNHHQNEKQLMLTARWWELDVEGIIAKVLSRPVKKAS